MRPKITRPRILAACFLILLFPVTSRAGGPAFVAGAGYDSGVEGQPLLWANASVAYYTDQAALSPILDNTEADALVAAAIAPWTSATGVSFSAVQAGHLTEDVNGSNIQAAQNGVITAPTDITPTATGTPLGIVYDFDGTVTDALLGQGAGGVEECFTNAVYGAPDNFSSSGNIAHAVVIINGVCAASGNQLADVQYRLVRVLARIFGLGWSQANVNVVTNKPAPSPDDYKGFPVMHFADPANCVPVTKCYSDPLTPKLDDVTAFARLYPASGGGAQSGRIWGNVYFTDSSGNATQPMQGVNVVARLLVTGQPSRQYVVTAVSGFSFVGNSGNIATGYLDSNGLPFNRFGSSDTAVEGYYDLGQLLIPNGQQTAQYQLSVEPLDPFWSLGVESYAPTQVAPSGSFAPVVVTVASGSNAERDILMLGGEIAPQHPGSGSTYTNPAPLPQGGGWASWISGYGASDWFSFPAQANRTASIAVTAIDETGTPSEAKLQPIIGVWELNDQTGGLAPASTPSAFNSLTFGMSRLDVQFATAESYKVGIVDYRGDGRPDYAYQASLLYSDSLTPTRASVAGGVATLQGLGFKPGLEVTARDNTATVLTQTATAMQITLPPAPLDGTATVQVTDPINGSFSRMLGALTYGAASDDKLALLSGGSQTTPVGSQAPIMVRVRATAADGVTPVNGATIAWSATNGVVFSACGGGTSCSVLTDGAGEAATWVTAKATGTGTITAALAPLSYSPPQTKQATLVGTSTSLDLAAIAPTKWIAQGATLDVPLTVEALTSGAPKANVTVNFTVTNGTATLSSGSAITDNSGMASVTAHVTAISANVQISACVSPGNSPCQTFSLFAVASSAWKLETVSGGLQFVPVGQSFQPLVMRVTDGSSADNPVLGANVTFMTTLERNPDGPGGGQQGDDGYEGGGGTPVILSTSQTQVVSDANGLASITPAVGSLGPCDVLIVVSAGRATAQLALESLPGTPLPPPGHQHRTHKQQPAPLFAIQVPEIPVSEPMLVWSGGVFPSDMAIDASSNSDTASSADSSQTPCDSAERKCSSARGEESLPAKKRDRPAGKPAKEKTERLPQANGPGTAFMPSPNPEPPRDGDSAEKARSGPSRSAAEDELHDRRSCRFALSNESSPP